MTQTVVIAGAKANDAARPGDKFRLTWTWTLAEYLPGNSWDVRRYDQQILEALPGMGFIPVSSPMAVPGDEVIVYDVRLAQSVGLTTVAGVIQAADRLPFLVNTAVNVSKIEKIPLNTPSVALSEGQSAAVTAGNNAAAGSVWTDYGQGIGDTLGGIGSAIDKYLTIIVLGAVVIAGVYIYRVK